MRFTVRRPPTGEVSPCGHRPPGGDIACSVHVGVARPRVAGFALEHRLALTVPGSDVPLLFIAMVVVVAVALANLLALMPARFAARTRIVELMRDR